MKKTIIAVVVASQSAFAFSLDGKYSDEAALANYTFSPDGKVIMSAMGLQGEMNYAVDGDKVKITTPQGTLVMAILNDGSIRGPMGMTLSKQQKNKVRR